MKLKSARSVGVTALALYLGGAFAPRVAVAQTPAEAIPSPAPAPAALPFADELAGRRLLFAARDAYRDAPAVRTTARWSVRRDLGTSRDTTTGTEAIAAEWARRRLALTTEWALPSDRKRVRRAIANDNALLTTRFEPGKTAAAPPTREFLRLTLAPGDTLPGALDALQVTPETEAGALLLRADYSIRGTTWPGKPQTVNGAPADEVWLALPDAPRQYDNGVRVVTTETRRYLLDRKTHLLRRYEAWSVARPQNAAARSAKNVYPRVTYRREDYTTAQASTAALPATLWSQALPPGYKEGVLPATNLARDAGPLEADAKARQLLNRWDRARDRMLSYFAQVEVTTVTDVNPANDTGNPRWQDGREQYTIWLRKPGQARLTLDAANGGGGRRRGSQSLQAVSDGEKLVVEDRTRNRTRTLPLADPSQLPRRLAQVGLDGPADLLSWLWDGPNRDVTRATYLGARVVDGRNAEVIELAQSRNGRDNQSRAVATTVRTTVALGADDLPFRIERRVEQRVSGLMERDQPPATVTTARFDPVRVDAPPPTGAFALASEDARGARPAR